MPKIAFGLGGNVGNVSENLKHAIRLLCALPYVDAYSLRYSSLYESPALLDHDAPSEWNMPFINQVVTLECHMQDWERLLHDVKNIESVIGRIKRGHWAPREIDVDIIYIDGVHYESDTLTIPHKEAHQRDFVLLPLKEIWEDCAFFNSCI